MTALLQEYGLSASLITLAFGAVLVFLAGSKLEAYADAIVERRGFGKAFAGTILIAVATSLPEVATTVPAVLRGNTDMAVFNLLGSSIFNLMILAMVDAVFVRGALTGFSPHFDLLIQGVGLILMFAVTGIVLGLEMQWPEASAIGAVPLSFVLVYVLVQYISMKAGKSPRWQPADAGNRSETARPENDDGKKSEGATFNPYWRYLGAAVVVVAAGYAIVLATESISEQTGLGKGLLGFTLVSFTTSLPEISTTFMAAKRRRLLTASSNIFGSNMFNTMLLALVAVLASGPIFENAAAPAAFAIGVNILMTATYLLGMLERRDQTIGRIGWDSLAVLILGFGGIAAMYLFKPSTG